MLIKSNVGRLRSRYWRSQLKTVMLYHDRIILGHRDAEGRFLLSSQMHENSPINVYDFHDKTTRIEITTPPKAQNSDLDSLSPEFWKEWNDLMAFLALRPNLKSIKLFGLPLTEIPANLQGLSQITDLTIGREVFSGWPLGLEKMKQLSILTLFESPVHEIPPEIGSLKNLTRLNLLHTYPLTDISPEIGHLSKLVTLSINTSVSLPRTIGQLSNLRTLIVESPEAIPFILDFGSLLKLESLRLVGCCPVTFPTGICELSTLTQLSIHISPLLALPEAIGNLRSLESLSLIGTDLVTLPESICSLSSLKTMDLTNNCLETLPDCLGDIPLIDLYIRNNKISQFPKSLCNLPFPYPPQRNACKGITIDESHVRSLHGLPAVFIIPFLLDHAPHDCNQFSPDNTQLSPDFVHTIFIPFQQDQKELLARTIAYYSKSVSELANQAVQDISSLSEQEWTRLIHEGTDREQQVLETCLTPDHQVLVAISTRKRKKLEGDIHEADLVRYLGILMNRQDAEVLVEIESYFEYITLGKPYRLVSEIENSKTGFAVHENRVVQLCVHYNQLKSLPESIGNLTSLTKLDLSRNELTSLPDSIGRLTSLTCLNLSHNKLASLPDSIENLSSLAKLNISSNKFTMLPKFIGTMTSLTELMILNNQLADLHESIAKLISLNPET